jgi:hypothetical protein
MLLGSFETLCDELLQYRAVSNVYDFFFSSLPELYEQFSAKLDAKFLRFKQHL